jgi:hypothetical protein
VRSGLPARIMKRQPLAWGSRGESKGAFARLTSAIFVRPSVRCELQTFDKGETTKTPLGVTIAVFGLAIFNLSAATLYVAERYNGNVVAVDTVTGEGKIVASGVGEMIGIAGDRRGRLFVSRFSLFSDGTVVRVDPVTGAFGDICRAAGAFGISADPDSDALYVGGYNSSVLHRLQETQPDVWAVDTAATFANSPIYPHAFRDGNLLYVTCESDGLWVKDLVSGNLRLMVAIPTAATTIAKESGGHLIVGSESMEKVVYRIDPSTGQIVQTYSGFSGPVGVAVDPSDNAVYVAETDAARIVRLDLSTGQRTVVSTSVESPWQIAFAMPLRISSAILSQNTLTLSWNGGHGIKLRKTTTLTTPDWQDVPGSDGQSSMSLPIADSSAFFRLVKP